MALPPIVRLLERRPVSYTVLVVFVLDRSLSMSVTRTYDRRSKWEHLVELVERILGRLHRSSMAMAFRVGFVWFSDTVEKVTSNGRSYFPVKPRNIALEVFRESVDRNTPAGMTAIADALYAASSIVEEYIEDKSIPSEKYVTVFLLTDGKETVKTEDDVLAAAGHLTFECAEKLRSLHERNSIGLATIALGLDADRQLLRDIASYLSEVQRQALEEHGVLSLVDPPYHEKMFIDAPQRDEITRDWEEAVRRFIEKLSETATVR